MNIYQWKEEIQGKRFSQYTHFDRRISIKRCFAYITNPDKVKIHGFYPFIHYTHTSRKIKNSPKERQIYYAAHIDSWIYRYYAYLVNEAYNQRVALDDIADVAIAYRTNLEKSNIDFAKNAFEFILNTTSSSVMIGDFTNFFDNLDHSYLKTQLCDLLRCEKLPDDFYAVYKSVTRFSYVELTELLALNGLKDNRLSRIKFNSSSNIRALSIDKFRQCKHIIHNFSDRKYGIPQGSPISAVFANVYMLTADKRLKEYVSSLGGLYMRYSDDFIIVIPQSIEHFEHHYNNIRSILDSIPCLNLEGSKTKIFEFTNATIKNCSSDFIEQVANGKNIIEFLGFAFDGQYIRIRDKTITKYYYRTYRKIKWIKNVNFHTNKGHVIDCKNLYRQYSYKGSRYFLKRLSRYSEAHHSKGNISGNFLDYVMSAKKTYGSKFVDTISKKHMQKIRKRLLKR